jgi:Gp5 C-terminal repeat (3 copies)
MHIQIHLRRGQIMLIVGAIALLTSAGIAFATIPDGSGVYTACRLNGVGTIRLIDPSGPSNSLLSHCTALETQISWSQQGPKGDTGANGTNGISPTVAQLAAGDSHCPAGGAALTDAHGTIAYVCSGQNGVDGKSFSGTFTSPDGNYSLSVTDAGVAINGPDARITMPSGGGLTITSNSSLTISGNTTQVVGSNSLSTIAGDRTETVSGNSTETVTGNSTETVSGNSKVTIGGNRSEKVGGDQTGTIEGNRSEQVSGGVTEKAAGALSLIGSTVGLNRSASCRPVARLGDSIAGTATPGGSVSGVIGTGSPSICVD